MYLHQLFSYTNVQYVFSDSTAPSQNCAVETLVAHFEIGKLTLGIEGCLNFLKEMGHEV